ncbi:nuclear receptor-interacting protein 2-like [Hyperolius riggenbachi]|uniref:nuclear receptor-interacting protein 2-like n=1 Tax=Hyperolius riggenbachi TaxID=752182 RepID=UPI0035A28DE4
MSCQKPPMGLLEDAKMRGSPRKEPAILHQQRRLKQATQFVHKDSADLLPLDQLRRLGTSKDLQPHSVIQRRLLGGSPVKESGSLAQSFHQSYQGTKSTVGAAKPIKRIDEDTGSAHNQDGQPETPNMSKETGWTSHNLLISCKVYNQDVSCKLSVERHDNLISKSCVQRLGLGVSCDPSERVKVEVEVGEEKLRCTAVVVEDNSAELSIGLDTLIKLKGCIDLELGVLKTPKQVLPFLTFFKNQPKIDRAAPTVTPVKSET